MSHRVLDIIARVTRYPHALLTPEATLEDDLGIDSVKQAEIFAVLKAELGVTAEVARGSVRTIGDVLRLVGDAAPADPAPEAAPKVEPQPVAVVAPVAPVADPLAELRSIVARVTRYPESLLTADAHLEDDLGIDSVKQAEIFVAVAERFPAAKGIDARRDGIATLGALAQRLASLLPAAPPPVEAPKPPRALRTVPPRSARALPLEGQVALVTGSGRGIGRAIALRLAELGATVVINAFHSRDAGEATAEEIRRTGGSASFVWGSVANEAHVAEIFDHIRREHGRLDLLVNNASDGIIGAFDEVTPRDWDRAFRTCVTGAHLCAMAAADLMGPRGGAIVNLSTITAHRYLRGFGSQGVVKAAVESLTRYLACELAPFGIRTNCVSAGPVYGELLEKFPEAAETIRHWESITPGGALCRPEDVVSVVEWLVDPRAARVNGAVWVVDGGVSAQIDGRFVRPEEERGAPSRWFAEQPAQAK